MRNVDVIKNMTPLEMMRFLCCWEKQDIDYARPFCDLCEDVDCERCLYDWLVQDSDQYGGLNIPSIECLWRVEGRMSRGFKNKEECCGTCKWHFPQDGEHFTDWYCVNDKSEYCTDVTPYDHSCGEYEERD